MESNWAQMRVRSWLQYTGGGGFDVTEKPRREKQWESEDQRDNIYRYCLCVCVCVFACFPRGGLIHFTHTALPIDESIGMSPVRLKP